MIELEKGADKYLLRDDFVEFSFRFVGDRWQHAVALRHGNVWRPVLISEEGQPADAVLRSPAFQDLRFEQPAEGVFEFQLMGQSGKGVYSAAVRFDAADRMLDFDLCARGPAADSSLCTVSTYLLAGDALPPFLKLEAGSAMIGPGDGGVIKIIPIPITGSPASECRLSADSAHRRLTVGCFGVLESNSGGKTRSIRWRHQIRG